MPDFGQLVVFEGADSVGKTTLSKAVASALTSVRNRCEWHAFPGCEEGTIGSLVYRLHHDPVAFNLKRLTAGSLQALHIAAHLDAIETRLLPTLRMGVTVILDRYWWSTWVYGIAARVEESVIRSLIDAEKAAWKGILPSAIYYVTRERPFADQNSKTWSALKTHYAGLIELEKRCYPVHTIQNEKTIDDAVCKILAML